jgi:hypothetical protein
MKFSDWNFRLRPRLEMGILEKNYIKFHAHKNSNDFIGKNI